MAILALAGLACGPSRPGVAEWTEVWAGRPEVPELAQFEANEVHSRCDRLLVDVREARERLLPTPDRELDRTVEQWIERAAGLGFDCPSGEGRSDQLQSLYQELQVLSSEVEAALATLSEPRPFRSPG